MMSRRIRAVLAGPELPFVAALLIVALVVLLVLAVT